MIHNTTVKLSTNAVHTLWELWGLLLLFCVESFHLDPSHAPDIPATTHIHTVNLVLCWIGGCGCIINEHARPV